MNSKQKVLITGADLAQEAIDLLADYSLVYAGKTPSEAAIEALCKLHDPVAIIVRYGKINATTISSAPSLKVISKHGSGTDTIDKAAAAARGIAVVAAAGANAAAVAEHALALLLACAKSIPQLDVRMKSGHWDKSTHKSIELEGRTIGLIGLGAIGLRFAKMVDAVGMKVLGFDPYAKDLPSYIQSASLEQIWARSDAISLHCPLTVDNASLINAQTLSQCKKGVMLINTARGGLVDEMALLQAMESGQVASAGLDTFAQEPMISPHPFHDKDRIILSPHIGGVSADAYVKMGVGAAQNVLKILNG